MSEKKLETLEEEVGLCSNKFDSYGGSPMKYRLTLHDLPYRRDSFGSLPSGKLWAVEYFTDNGYRHCGGWCWNKPAKEIYYIDVNEDLFDKRKLNLREEVMIPEFYEYGEKRLYDRNIKKLRDLDQYMYLSKTGDIVKYGDIVTVSIKVERNGMRSNDICHVYGMIHWDAVCGGTFGDWHYDLYFYGNHQDYNGKYTNVSVRDVIVTGELVTPKEGYRHLNLGARKRWRWLNNIKGQPKFT